jgi:hypothetical protein
MAAPAGLRSIWNENHATHGGSTAEQAVLDITSLLLVGGGLLLLLVIPAESRNPVSLR